MFKLLVIIYNNRCIKNEVLKFDDITSAETAYKRIQEKSSPLGLEYTVIKLY